MASDDVAMSDDPQRKIWSNFITYSRDEDSAETRVGHLDMTDGMITPLSFASGARVSDLYEVIEVGYDTLIAGGSPISLDSVKILPPLTQRDVLAVGKNYGEHAKEFKRSGYDMSDRNDMPSHPVLFTKRATSIIADGEEIWPHIGFTRTLDYEGEIGAIIGKSGFRIPEENAADYIWGYTLINDISARERQRDHKQFYIGKSADTFCPMGPIAVPVQHLPAAIQFETRVNGEIRQRASTKDLIFSVPNLIATLSEAQTIQAGDIIATGTPVGVGFGFHPPKFLRPGDEMQISATGLGRLRNRISSFKTPNTTSEQVARRTAVPTANLERTYGGVGLTSLQSGRKLSLDTTGPSPPKNPVIMIHGLGGSSTYFAPLIATLSEHYTCITLDLEGHGLSPTFASSTTSISSYVSDIAAVFSHFHLSTATIIGHNLGGTIAASFATKYPAQVTQLILLGPVLTPIELQERSHFLDCASYIRENGMRGIASSIVNGTLSPNARVNTPLAYAAVLSSIQYTHPEGYAKGAAALANCREDIILDNVKCPVLVVSGGSDRFCSQASVEKLKGQNSRVESVQLNRLAGWYLYEDVASVKSVVERALGIDED